MVTESVKYRYVHEDTSRHGQVRLYFRAPRHLGWKRKHRLPGPIGSDEFMAQYRRLLDRVRAGLGEPPLASKAAPDRRRIAPPLARTWRWLCVEYMASPEFRGLASNTQLRRRVLLDATCLEPVEPGSQHLVGDAPIDPIEGDPNLMLRIFKVLVERIRPKRGDRGGPEAANDRARAIRGVCAWAHENELTATHLARDLKLKKSKGRGYHTVTVEEILQFYRNHQPGSQARLMLDLLLYTGARRSDAHRLGRQHFTDGRSALTFWTYKGRNRPDGSVQVTIPVLAALARALEVGPTGDLSFVVHGDGQIYTKESFGNRMKAHFAAAGLPHCSAHGLRKAAACICAERGATTFQMMAIFGWKTEAQATRYVREARRKIMAGKLPDLLVLDGASASEPDDANLPQMIRLEARGGDK